MGFETAKCYIIKIDFKYSLGKTFAKEVFSNISS